MIKQVLVLAMILTLFNSCGKENICPDKDQIHQEIIFQLEFINHAWGYHHYGWLIDSTGNVYCYNSPDNWIHCDSEGLITASDMTNNIKETNSICYNIDKEELVSKFTLIMNASKGQISEPVNEMYDAGITGYYGYVYSPELGLYKRILLKQIGDFRTENNSKEAKILYNWLEQVNLEINN